MKLQILIQKLWNLIQSEMLQDSNKVPAWSADHT